MSGCAAPAEGLALDCQLARDPSSGCIATTRSSLSGSKLNLVKNLVSSLAEDSLVIVSDWLEISLLYNVGITITLHSFTYLYTLLVV